MALPIWKGHISFGLVNVPVALYSAERNADLHFHLIDSRDAARVRYERVNADTGEEVPWDKIVKGFEYDGGNYVLLSDKELESASPEMNRAIEIERFVGLDQIEPRYFDKPYYLVPQKGGEKGYVLLREAMARTGLVGVASVVIRTRQYVAALLPQGKAIVLILLRFQQELREPEDAGIPEADARHSGVGKRELELAEQLVEGMRGDWRPRDFHDEYRDALMQMIEKKIKSGKTKAIAEPEEAAEEEPLTINFIEALKKSVARSSRKKTLPKKRRMPAKGQRAAR